MRKVRLGRPIVLNAWINAASARTRLARARRKAVWYEDMPRLLDKYAPGHSFVDIGCMWNVNGGIAFEAEARVRVP